MTQPDYSEASHHYDLIAEAIRYLNEHLREQPSLDKLAEHLQLSPFYLQRVFSDWAGVSPKKFLQYLNLEYSKNLLRNQQWSLLDTAQELGLSGTSRLHDLFVQIEGMTPGDYKNGGENLIINFSAAKTQFGAIFIASTQQGICQITFEKEKNSGEEKETSGLQRLQTELPRARLIENTDAYQKNALQFFTQDQSLAKIKLHLKATDFQLKVWSALLKIPQGKLATYGQIAESIQQTSAARAVGTAIGKNPIAFLIPCHRVIQATGHTGGYMWGSTRKSAILGWEAAKTDLIK